jgi:hypothetical protein
VANPDGRQSRSRWGRSTSGAAQTNRAPKARPERERSEAREKWTAEKRVGLWEIGRRLGPAQFRRVTEALAIYSGAEVPEANDPYDELAA